MAWSFAKDQPVTTMPLVDEAVDSLSLLGSSWVGPDSSPSLMARILPNEGRAGRGLSTSSNSSPPLLPAFSSRLGFFLPAPNKVILDLDRPGGDSGSMSSGEVGGLAATPTTSASSSKLTLTGLRFKPPTRGPSSEPTDVPSDSSLGAGAGRTIDPGTRSGDKDPCGECFIADLTGDTDLGGGWCNCSPATDSWVEKRAARPGLLLGCRTRDVLAVSSTERLDPDNTMLGLSTGGFTRSGVGGDWII